MKNLKEILELIPNESSFCHREILFKKYNNYIQIEFNYDIKIKNFYKRLTNKFKKIVPNYRIYLNGCLEGINKNILFYNENGDFLFDMLDSKFIEKYKEYESNNKNKFSSRIIGFGYNTGCEIEDIEDNFLEKIYKEIDYYLNTVKDWYLKLFNNDPILKSYIDEYLTNSNTFDKLNRFYEIELFKKYKLDYKFYINKVNEVVGYDNDQILDFIDNMLGNDNEYKLSVIGFTTFLATKSSNYNLYKEILINVGQMS